MCILCVVQRWSRRVATMLPWLVIPLIALWAFSQLLPPPLRFEITSPRLACVTVLLVTLFWYEVLMPQLSSWRARRSARLRECRRSQALELQKLRKSATRRCRNCLTPYRDQNPGGGRFMCSYCGHMSKRPVLDLPGGASSRGPGINGWIYGQDWVREGSESWAGTVPRYLIGNGGGDDLCMTEKSYSGALLFACRLLSCFFVSMRWLLTRVFRVGSSSEDALDGDDKGSLRKGENGGNCQESRGEKARRKAEEKRQARLEKEMLEEEERKQREEVARLVEERRKLRDEILEVERIHSKGLGHNGDRERRKEAEKRRQERLKEREKDKGSSKSNSDVEEYEKTKSKENDKKRGDLDKKSENERRDAQKAALEKQKLNSLEQGNGIKAAASKAKYLDRVKGSFLASSKGINGASFFERNAQNATASINKVSKPAAGNKDAQFVTGKFNSVADDRISKSSFDRAVESEVGSPTPAPKKSWHQLFTRSSVVSPQDDVNTSIFLNQNGRKEAQSALTTDQKVLLGYSLDNQASFLQPHPFSVYPSVNGSTSGNFERGQNPPLEEAENFKDPCHIPERTSLLGPLTDSLDNFPLDIGAGFVACSRIEKLQNVKKIAAPVDVNKPSPIESPISRPRVSEGKHDPIGLHPTPPKSVDNANNADELPMWHMWGTPLVHDALDTVSGSANWFLPLGQKKLNLEDMMHSSGNSMISQIAVENHGLPGNYASQNVCLGNYLNGGSFSPIDRGLTGNDPWMQKAAFLPLSVDGESHFPPLSLVDNAKRHEVKYDGPNGLEAHCAFEVSPATCWSKKDWTPHRLEDVGNLTPALHCESLFSTGPDIRSVWASNKNDSK